MRAGCLCIMLPLPIKFDICRETGRRLSSGAGKWDLRSMPDRDHHAQSPCCSVSRFDARYCTLFFPSHASSSSLRKRTAFPTFTNEGPLRIARQLRSVSTKDQFDNVPPLHLGLEICYLSSTPPSGSAVRSWCPACATIRARELAGRLRSRSLLGCIVPLAHVPSRRLMR